MFSLIEFRSTSYHKTALVLLLYSLFLHCLVYHHGTSGGDTSFNLILSFGPVIKLVEDTSIGIGTYRSRE